MNKGRNNHRWGGAGTLQGVEEQRTTASPHSVYVTGEKIGPFEKSILTNGETFDPCDLSPDSVECTASAAGSRP